MEYKFICGEGEFYFKLPKIKDFASIKAMEGWAKLINEAEHKEDRWDKVPPLPYEFKNLRILRSDFDFDITEENYNVTVTFIYDTVTLNGEEIGLQ